MVLINCSNYTSLECLNYRLSEVDCKRVILLWLYTCMQSTVVTCSLLWLPVVYYRYLHVVYYMATCSLLWLPVYSLLWVPASRVGQYFNIIATLEYQGLQYQYCKHFHISMISHVQYIAEYCHVMHIIVLQYSVLNKFVPIPTIEKTDSYQQRGLPLQFLMAHMYNDVES